LFSYAALNGRLFQPGQGKLKHQLFSDIQFTAGPPGLANLREKSEDALSGAGRQYSGDPGLLPDRSGIECDPGVEIGTGGGASRMIHPSRF
jgi:hypothetical protein